MDFLSYIVAGGVGAALTSGLFLLLQTVVNKKLRTPADQETRTHNAIDERARMMAQYKSDANEAKTEAKAAREEASAAKQQAEDTDHRLDQLRDEFFEFKQEWLHWGYRAVATIRRLGTDEDVPRPTPKGLNI